MLVHPWADLIPLVQEKTVWTLPSVTDLIKFPMMIGRVIWYPFTEPDWLDLYYHKLYKQTASQPLNVNYQLWKTISMVIAFVEPTVAKPPLAMNDCGGFFYLARSVLYDVKTWRLDGTMD